MKRLTIVTALVILTISATGCLRGFRGCGLRGARCAPVPAPTPAPVYYGTGAYCPPTTVAPTVMAPATTCPCPTTSSYPIVDPGYGDVISDPSLPPIQDQGFSTVPSSFSPPIGSGPAYSRVISDRKLGEGETIPSSLPVSSASKANKS